MSIPTDRVTPYGYESDGDRDLVDVPLSQDVRDDAQVGDVIVLAGGGDKLGVVAVEDGSAYASAGWTVENQATQASEGGSVIVWCKITNVGNLPTTVEVDLDANRESVWGIYVLVGVDTANIEGWDNGSSSDPSFAEDSDLNTTTGTANDDNRIISVTGNQGSATYNANDLTLTPGSWTVDFQGFVDWTVDAWAAIGHIDQASAGTLAKQDLFDGQAADACTTVAFPGTAGAATRDGDATLTGVGVVSASGATVAADGAATLTGVGVTSAVGTATRLGTASLAGVGVVSAAGVVGGLDGVATLTGVGSISAAGNAGTNGAAVLTGSGVLTAIGTATRIAVVGLIGVGSVTATGTATRLGAVTLTGSGVLSAAADTGIVFWPPPTVTDDGPRGVLAAAIAAAVDAGVAVLPAPVAVVLAPAVVIRPSDPYQVPIVAAGAAAAAWAFEVDLIVDRRYSSEGLALLDALRLTVTAALPSGYSWLGFTSVGELTVGKKLYLHGVLEVAAVVLADSRT